VKEAFKHIAAITSLCAKCHLCKNDSPKFAEKPHEHNTIRGRIALIDAACRGKISFNIIKPFIEEMTPWTKEMNCPTYIKDKMEELIEVCLAEGK